MLPADNHEANRHNIKNNPRKADYQASLNGIKNLQNIDDQHPPDQSEKHRIILNRLSLDEYFICPLKGKQQYDHRLDND
ncbi:hypothetical protein D3C73_1573400 [compost metagenome]